MTLLKSCMLLIDHFKSSPVRVLSKNRMLAVQRTAELDKCIEEAIILKEKVNTKLKVVIVGEVKSGKSTLINALTGMKVSPTNVLEATSTIFETGYAESDHCEVHYNNGVRKSVSIEDMLIELEALTDAAAHGVSKVVTYTSVNNFTQLYLIDTPGLATITSQNATITSDYMQEADFIVWVFNANHLGQKDIADEVSKIAMFGKPMVAVINKIDEVDGSPDRLVRYVDRALGEYFSQVFALSAVSINVVAEDVESGFSTFKKFLVEKINAKSESIQNESIYDSLSALNRRDLAIHRSIARGLDFLIEQHKEHISDLALERKELEASVLSNLNSMIVSFKMNSSSDSQLLGLVSDGYEKKADEVFKGLANQFYDKTLTDLRGMYRTKFADSVKRISIKLLSRFNAFQSAEDERLHLDISSTLFDTVIPLEKSMIDSAAKSGTIAGSLGLGIAAYGAWFGPYASSLTLVGGISAVALPFAFFGIAGGLAMGYWNNKEQKRKEAQKKLGLAMEQIAFVVEENVRNTILGEIKHDFDMVSSQYISELCLGNSLDEIKSLIFDLSYYVEQGELLKM
ncbi:MAG: dynamin family protein [Moraxellaceae bacterium]|nr:dynamin family protein [Moraxellaceae bacterium]MCP5177109.1 dynamin family protein [Moraxellaceae bacterium]